MIPMKDVTAKPTGMVINWDHSASLGFLAKRAKSGSLTYQNPRSQQLHMIADFVPLNKSGEYDTSGGRITAPNKTWINRDWL